MYCAVHNLEDSSVCYSDFRGSEEEDDPDGCVFLLLCICVLWWEGDQGLRWKQPQHRKQSESTDKETSAYHCPSLSASPLFVSSSLSASVSTSHQTSCVETLQTLFTPNFIVERIECTLCVYLCVCFCLCMRQRNHVVHVWGTALLVQNNRLCPESSFILRHVSS